MTILNLEKINLDNLEIGNPFELIGNDWMLITAGDKSNFNTMTASWGGLGVLWNKKVSFCFVRPQRFTFEFMEKSDYYSLSFYDSNYKDSLRICGTTSGRDVNKVEKTGFTPCFKEKAPYFEESKLVFICKKVYTQFIDPKCMIDSKLELNYKDKDYHKMYVGEIIECMVKK